MELPVTRTRNQPFSTRSVERRLFRSRKPSAFFAAPCLIAALVSGCSRDATPTHEPGLATQPETEGQSSTATAASPASGPAQLDIHLVLKTYQAGQTDEAVRLLLVLTEPDAPPERLWLYDLSEEQFVKLVDWQAKRDEMVARFRELGHLTREIERRAAAAAGDFATAERLYLAIRRLGVASTGPANTKFADAFGHSLVRRADAALAGLKERNPSSGASPTTRPAASR